MKNLCGIIFIFWILWIHFYGKHHAKNSFHYAKKDLHSEILSSCLITDILTRILIENDTESLGLGFMPDYLKTVLKEIDQHFSEPLCLEDLADLTGISKISSGT